MAKPKIALFSFTCCEGCSLEILNCENEMVDLLGALEITNYREARTDRSDDYDIAFIDYRLPARGIGRLFGLLLGRAYAAWCTRRMAGDARAVFSALDADKEATAR